MPQLKQVLSPLKIRLRSHISEKSTMLFYVTYSVYYWKLNPGFYAC